MDEVKEGGGWNDQENLGMKEEVKKNAREDWKKEKDLKKWRIKEDEKDWIW